MKCQICNKFIEIELVDHHSRLHFNEEERIERILDKKWFRYHKLIIYHHWNINVNQFCEKNAWSRISFTADFFFSRITIFFSFLSPSYTCFNTFLKFTFFGFYWSFRIVDVTKRGFNFFSIITFLNGFLSLDLWSSILLCSALPSSEFEDFVYGISSNLLTLNSRLNYWIG